MTSPDGLFLQTIYHPLRLFADHLGEQALDVFTSCDTHELAQPAETESWPHQVADLGPFPVLDAVATYSPDRREVMLSVINRDPEHDVSTELQLAQAVAPVTATVEEVNGDAVGTTNSFDARRRSPCRPAPLRSSRPAPHTRSRLTPSPCSRSGPSGISHSPSGGSIGHFV